MASGTIIPDEIGFVDIIDSTPVNVNTASGRLVTNGNFISAVPLDVQVIALPYFNNGTQYLALKDLSLNAVSGAKNIRVYYRR